MAALAPEQMPSNAANYNAYRRCVKDGLVHGAERPGHHADGGHSEGDCDSSESSDEDENDGHSLEFETREWEVESLLEKVGD